MKTFNQEGFKGIDMKIIGDQIRMIIGFGFQNNIHSILSNFVDTITIRKWPYEPEIQSIKEQVAYLIELQY